jgi:hypothetical protein
MFKQPTYRGHIGFIVFVLRITSVNVLRIKAQASKYRHRKEWVDTRGV